ncbi:MAG: CbtA family protein [Alphaproteobacteria bacterium]|nr:CbtA family protein [Alphaproteobacteria bacterium]MBV8413418.1 CbtA family protein [Alphaproteobacteria bacterium]
MLTRLLSVGLLAGLLAGLLIALVQQVTTTPLILLAETYENQDHGQAKGPEPGHDHGPVHDHAHDHGSDEGWKPADGLPRFFFTSLATIATAVGMAFLLLAGMTFSGDPIDGTHALAWAIAGFVAMGLAPAAGLAPELPGSASGALLARQVWWIATAAATALALWMFLRLDNPLARLAAIVLLLAPHLIGAPHPHAFESRVPAEIAAQFAARSLVVQGLLWTAVGVAIGYLWPRLAAKPARRPVVP